MNRRHVLALSTALVALAAGAGSLVLAQEHPSLPREKKDTVTQVTKEAIGEAVRKFIGIDMSLKGGWFLIWDKDAQKPLVLSLDVVHDDKLTPLKEDLHFACADFKTKDGKTVYDLDFLLKGKTVETLSVSEIAVHKEDGKPRYDWVEEGGFWKKKPHEAK